MKRLSSEDCWNVEYQDRLVIRWGNWKTGERFQQGKRVKKDCPLTAEERRIYVEKGIVCCVKAIRQRKGETVCLVKEAVDLLNSVRF